MAKLHKIVIVAAVCFAVIALLFSPTLAQEEGDEGDYSPGPASDGDGEDYTDDPFLDECLTQISPECSDDILSSLFVDHPSVTKTCCIELVAMGKECHDGLVNRLLESPDLVYRAPQARKNSELIWSQCASRTASSPSPL